MLEGLLINATYGVLSNEFKQRRTKKILAKIIKESASEIQGFDKSKDELGSLVNACFEDENIRDILSDVGSGNDYNYIDLVKNRVIKNAKIYGIEDTRFVIDYMKIIEGKIQLYLPELYSHCLLQKIYNDNITYWEKINQITSNNQKLISACINRVDEIIRYKNLKVTNFDQEYKIWIEKKKNTIEEKIPYLNTESEVDLYYQLINSYLNHYSWKSNIKLQFKALTMKYDDLKKNIEFSETVEEYIADIEYAINSDRIFEEIQVYVNNFIKKLLTKLKAVEIKLSDEDILRQYKYMLNDLNLFREKVLNPYGNALLVEGGTGVGKSHFLYDLIERSSERIDNTFVFPIESYKNHGMIDEIYRSINKCWNLEISNFNELEAHFLHNKLSNYKIIIAIDDIHLVDKGGIHIEELKSLLQEVSKYDWIYWFISIHKFHKDLVLDNKGTFQKYSYTEFIGNESIEFSLGWLDLEKFVSLNKIGRSILENYYGDFDYDFLMENPDGVEIIRHPLIAQIYKESNSSIKENALVYSYILAAKEYVHLIFNKLLDNSTLDTPMNEKEYFITTELESLTTYIYELCKFFIEDEAIGYIKESHEILLKQLIRNSMIKESYIKCNDNLSEMGYHMKRYLEFEPRIYWIYKIVMHTIKNSLDIDNALNFEEYDRECIVALLLQYHNENEIMELDNIYATLIKKGLISELLLSSTLIKKENREKVVEYFISISPEGKRGKRYLYAYLFFINYIEEDELFFTQKIKAISQISNSIQQNGLSRFGAYVIESIISRIKSAKVVKKCMRELCTLKNDVLITAAAESTFYKLDTLFYDKYDMVRYLKSFLFEKAYHEVVYSSITNTGDNEMNYVNELIKVVIRTMVRRMGLKFFDILLEDNVDWLCFMNDERYYDDNQKKVIKLMRSNVAIQFAKLYRYRLILKDEKNEFYNRLGEFINSGVAIKKIHAYHYISNIYDESEDIILESGLYSIIELLRNDRQLKEFNDKIYVKKFYSRFERVDVGD